MPTSTTPKFAKLITTESLLPAIENFPQKCIDYYWSTDWQKMKIKWLQGDLFNQIRRSLETASGEERTEEGEGEGEGGKKYDRPAWVFDKNFHDI